MAKRIEELDQRFPGLADKVRTWFNQGVPVRKVADLLFEQYQVAVPRATVGNFRARCWAPERELANRKRMTQIAIEEILRELEMKDSPVVSTASVRAKLISFFFADKSHRLQTIADGLVEVNGRLLE